MATTSPHGDRLVLARGGGDAGRPLLFVHGWTCRRDHWSAQMAAFAPAHPVAALDLSGHGESGCRGRGDWSVTGLAGDVQAALAALGWQDAVLVGHSMGGAVALEAALRVSERVAAVVLADSFVLPYGDLTEDDARAIEAPFHADFAAAIDGLVEQTGGALSAAEKDSLKAGMAAADPAWALPLWADLLRWTPDTAFAGIEAPIHAINGALIPEVARQRCAPHLSERLLPGAGHFLQMEQPAAFNRSLHEVLAAL
ncbi:MAG TPA: alpha/beta fold hydrolase [Thioalkalivibrio sp.]|nr:alpha/beta fold hydrolase [Thioalkalivibrio sp.]